MSNRNPAQSKKNTRSGSVAEESIICEPSLVKRTPNLEELKKNNYMHMHARSEVVLKEASPNQLQESPDLSAGNTEEFDNRKERITRKMR